MKPSHLAALCLAGLGIGGMSSASLSIPPVAGELFPITANKHATAAANKAMQIVMNYDLHRGGYPIQQHPISWRKLNQRQLRKNRRRAHAAGKRNAFA